MLLLGKRWANVSERIPYQTRHAIQALPLRLDQELLERVMPGLGCSLTNNGQFSGHHCEHLAVTSSSQIYSRIGICGIEASASGAEAGAQCLFGSKSLTSRVRCNPMRSVASSVRDERHHCGHLSDWHFAYRLMELVVTEIVVRSQKPDRERRDLFRTFVRFVNPGRMA